jgi:uncharacterized protein (DUF1697 family)
MTQYLALLRGINVGGNNIIKMVDLKRWFEDQGFENVATFIQSGNVLFDSSEKRPATLADRIESGLLARFAYAARIVLRSHEQMSAALASAPSGFGTEPDLYRYDALFVRAPVSVSDVLPHLKPRDGVDTVAAGPGVCYFSRLISRASQSYLSKIVTSPVYKDLTIRNWATTSKLAALMDARASAVGAPTP